MKLNLDHIVLNVQDAVIAADFYHNILELEIERLEKFKNGSASFPSVRINRETVIDLFPPEMWRKEGDEDKSSKINLNHFCLNFAANDWNRLIERLKMHDIKIKKYTDNNWGAQGIGISVYFDDVDGNEIEARFYRSW